MGRRGYYSKVGNIVDSDSDKEEVVNNFDESVNLSGGGHDRDNDYAKQVYDLLGNLNAFYDMYGIKL